jgi:hypothetical protein
VTAVAKLYDNVEDASGKLLGTIIYYDDRPCIVKDVSYTFLDSNMSEQEILLILSKGFTGRGTQTVNLSDPKLNYMRYNLGYANFPANAVWWYRVPYRQYRQGLRHDQVRYRTSKAFDIGFNFNSNKHIEAMLMNRYPSITEAVEQVRQQEDLVVAFHKDVGVSWDKLHKDVLIEFKGQVVGCADAKFNNVNVLDTHTFLNETIREAINAA